MPRRAQIRVCVAGVTGWTGSAVAAAVRDAASLDLVSGMSRSDADNHSSVAEALDAVEADVLVDYTHAEAVRENVSAAIERGVNVVVGSSGLSADDYSEIDKAARDHKESAWSLQATSRSRRLSCSRQRSTRPGISTPGR